MPIKIDGQSAETYEPSQLYLTDRSPTKKEIKRGISLNESGGARHLEAGARGIEKARMNGSNLRKRPVTLGRTFSWEKPKE
jgi:hypothetical protein